MATGVVQEVENRMDRELVAPPELARVRFDVCSEDGLEQLDRCPLGVV
jgi:hypothetical protein